MNELSGQIFYGIRPVSDPGERPGGPATSPPPPLIFRPNWGPKGEKKIFFGDQVPLLSEGLDQRLSPFVFS